MSTGWQLATLEQVSTDPIVYGIVQPGEPVPEGVPFVQTRDIGSRLDITKLDRTDPKIAAAYGRSTLRPGDILVALRSDIGSAAVVPIELDGANISRGVARVRIGSANDSEFVRYALESPAARDSIRMLTSGSTLRELSIGALRQVQISVPPLPEQRKIVEILCTWDDAIEKASALVAHSESKLSALVSELFTPSTKHRNLALSDLVSPVKTKNSAGATNVLTSSGKRGLVSQADYYNKNVASADTSGYYLIENGDFAYNRSSSFGYPFGAIKRLDRYQQGLLSTLYLCFRLTNTDDVDSDYLTHFFESGVLNRQLVAICQEGARSHGLLNVTQADFFELVVPVPAIERQQQIARALNEATKELELLEKKRVALTVQKRGLMQKLLTGEIRVTGDEYENLGEESSV